MQSKDGGARLFSVVPSDTARDTGPKLKQKKLHLGIRKKDFSVRVIKHWHMLPREFVESMEIINPYGHNPEHRALADRGLSWEVELDDL